MKYLIILCTLFSIHSSFVFSQELQLISHDTIASGQAIFTLESHYTLTFDAANNKYATGNFSFTHDFDQQLSVENRTAQGLSDLFLRQEDSLDNLEWVIQIGAPNATTYGQDIQLDSEGNIFVLGFSSSNSLDLDPGPGVFIPTEYFDGYFLSKFSNTGDFIWGKFINTIGPSKFLIDKTDNIILTTNRYHFVSSTETTYSCLVQRLSSLTGSVEWSNEYENDAVTSISDIVNTEDNSLIFTGSFYGEIGFNFLDPLDVHLAEDLNNTFSVKLNSQGEYIWSKSFTGFGGISSNSLFLIDSSLFLTGSFKGTFDFDLNSGEHILSTGLNYASYVLKMNLSGDFDWVNIWDGLGTSTSFNSIQKDDEDNLYLAGNAVDNVNGIGDLHPGFAIDPHGANSSFLMKLDSEGTYIWSKSFPSYNSGSELTKIWLKGNHLYFSSPVSFSTNVSFDTSVVLDVALDASTGFGCNLLKKYSIYADPCSNFTYDLLPSRDKSCTELGSISVLPLNGEPPFQYTWADYPLNNSSIQYLDSLHPTSVTITDANGCEITINAIINGPEHPFSSDMKGNLVLVPFRTGFVSDGLIVHVFNDGCVPTDGKIKLVLSPLIELVDASVEPNEIEGDTLIWNFEQGTFSSEHFVADLDFLVTQDAQIGDTALLILILESNLPDANESNNTRYHFVPIVNGYDPNDIQVSPQGVCEELYVDKNERLTYVIRFQNTGNAEAVHISVLNEIDSSLDISSLRVIGKSFEDLAVEILQENWIKFHMDSIMLPDSAGFGDDSKGYIIYEIWPKASVNDDVEFYNQAQIYFDFNPPIITNQLMNTLIDSLPDCPNSSGLDVVETSLNESFQIFPNPTNGKIYVVNPTQENLKIYNVNGLFLIEHKKVNQIDELDLHHFSQGIYFVYVGESVYRFAKN